MFFFFVLFYYILFGDVHKVEALRFVHVLPSREKYSKFY